MDLTTLIRIATASRPFPGESVNGDLPKVSWNGSTCRIALIDGLGHGPDAALASQAAAEELAAHPELGPGEALHRCHNRLKGTRGAAISVASIDCTAWHLTVAGIGNVDVLVRQGGQNQRIVADRGIVGAALPSIHLTDVELQSGWLLIVHSDGVSARFDVHDLAWDVDQDPQVLADLILAQWSRPLDDATVVVATAAR